MTRLARPFVAALASGALIGSLLSPPAALADSASAPVAPTAPIGADALTAEGLSESIGGEGTVEIELGEASESGVTVPASLDEPIVVDAPGGETTSLSVPALPGAPAVLTERGDVVVPAENEGAELLIQEVDTAPLSSLASGTRTLLVIGDRDVDPLFRFDVDVPDGGRIEQDHASGATVVYKADGSISSAFGLPWAYDADGQEVPTWYEVEGSTLLQYVDHLSADFAYPVVADPVWFVPLLLLAGRIIIKEVVSASVTAAVAAAVASEPGSKPADYKSFTSANARFNLIVKTKRDPGNKCDAHHTLPQMFRRPFVEAGFTGSDSIDHPKYLIWWERSDHRSKASKVNAEWTKWWRDKNPEKTSKSSVLNKRTAVILKYPPNCIPAGAN